MTLPIDLSNLNTQEKLDLIAALEAKDEHERFNKIDYVYPAEHRSWVDGTPLYPLDSYPKNKQFYEAGKEWKHRATIGGERSGKTYCNAVELTYHATGNYPSWWNGKVFHKPAVIWVIVASARAGRQGVQEALLGPTGGLGTGLIPKACILKTYTKKGIPGAIELAEIKTPYGQSSMIYFLSTDQPVDAFKSAAVDIVYFDEQCDNIMIYKQAIIRTSSTQGIVMAGFTPANFDEVVQQYMPNGMFPENNVVDGKYVVGLSFLDAPHVTEEEKQKQIESCPTAYRDNRIYGIPLVGTGLIYAQYASINDIAIDPIEIPEYWPRICAVDDGWNCTAAVFLAIDPNTGVYYFYDEYVGQHKTPAQNAIPLRTRLKGWIPHFIDPNSDSTAKSGHSSVFKLYQAEGLNFQKADNRDKEGQIANIQDMLSRGQIKITKNCYFLMKAYAVYRRKENGDIVKGFDHPLDAMRYAIISVPYAKSEQQYLNETDPDNQSSFSFNTPSPYRY